MKSFVASLVVLAAVGAVIGQGPDREMMKANMEACMSSTGASQSDADIVHKHEVPTTTTASCLYACMKKKMGLMNADNTMNVAKAKEMLSPMKNHSEDNYNKMMTVIDNCKAAETATSDECAAAKNLVTCMVNGRNAAGITMERRPTPPSK